MILCYIVLLMLGLFIIHGILRGSICYFLSDPVQSYVDLCDIQTGDLILFGPKRKSLFSSFFSTCTAINKPLLDKNNHFLAFHHVAIAVRMSSEVYILDISRSNKGRVAMKNILESVYKFKRIYVRRCLPNTLRPSSKDIQSWIDKNKDIRLVPTDSIYTMCFWILVPWLNVTRKMNPPSRTQICSQFCYNFYKHFGMLDKNFHEYDFEITPRTLGDAEESPWLGPLERVCFYL